MGKVRDLFNAKLAKMSPEERAFSDEALIDAIDEVLEPLFDAVTVTSPIPRDFATEMQGVSPFISMAPASAVVTPDPKAKPKK